MDLAVGPCEGLDMLQSCKLFDGVRLFTLLLFGLNVCVTGCTSESTASQQIEAVGDLKAYHDHTDRDDSVREQRDVSLPLTDQSLETFVDAVDLVVRMDEAIRIGFAEGDVEAAHEPLHDIGKVLKRMNHLSQESALTTDQRDLVQGAVARLFEAFGAVDATMHDREGMSYEEASLVIEENLELLKALCARQSD